MTNYCEHEARRRLGSLEPNQARLRTELKQLDKSSPAAATIRAEIMRNRLGPWGLRACNKILYDCHQDERARLQLHAILKRGL